MRHTGAACSCAAGGCSAPCSGGATTTASGASALLSQPASAASAGAASEQRQPSPSSRSAAKTSTPRVMAAGAAGSYLRSCHVFQTCSKNGPRKLRSRRCSHAGRGCRVNDASRTTLRSPLATAACTSVKSSPATPQGTRKKRAYRAAQGRVKRGRSTCHRSPPDSPPRRPAPQPPPTWPRASTTQQRRAQRRRQAAWQQPWQRAARYPKR